MITPPPTGATTAPFVAVRAPYCSPELCCWSAVQRCWKAGFGLLWFASVVVIGSLLVLRAGGCRRGCLREVDGVRMGGWRGLNEGRGEGKEDGMEGREVEGLEGYIVKREVGGKWLIAHEQLHRKH